MNVRCRPDKEKSTKKEKKNRKEKQKEIRFAPTYTQVWFRRIRTVAFDYLVQYISVSSQDNSIEARTNKITLSKGRACYKRNKLPLP